MSAPAPIAIVDYDPAWPLRFKELASRVQSSLGERVLRVEHVGSTAIPGLAAKPIIDLDVVVNSPSDVESAIRGLAAIGYMHEGDLGVQGREAFLSPAGESLHHLYVLVDGTAELQGHLAFRDSLRANPALRHEYAALKRTLAAQHANDRAAYTQGKSAFIRAVLRDELNR